MAVSGTMKTTHSGGAVCSVTLPDGSKKSYSGIWQTAVSGAGALSIYKKGTLGVKKLVASYAAGKWADSSLAP
jgi:hypothetical protein